MISMVYKGNNNTIDLINTPNLIISGYSGLDQPVSETITLTNPNLRGTQYQRSQIQDRLISFSFVCYDVENVRYKLMSVFKSGEKGVLTLKNDFREGQIDCYFEELTFDKFSNPTVCNIFLRSPYPYFKGLSDILAEITNVMNMFVLEANIPEEGIVLGEILDEQLSVINNNSDVETGLTIEISASDTVVNPVVFNQTTNKYIGVNRTMSKGEKLIITTSAGNKKVLLEENGTTTNIINRLMIGSSFIQLARGNNSIKVEASSGGKNMIVFLKYCDEYEAI